MLLRRLLKWHATYGDVQRDHYAVAAGLGGEERFDHYFAASPVEFTHIMLHNVTLRSFRVFQNDSEAPTHPNQKTGLPSQGRRFFVLFVVFACRMDIDFAAVFFLDS
ncbi:hypothetical protein [Planococcus sp. CAU13]|uniref:hypothetical protein n=1 Tax=Planococcus sp. CAU13 TaxID=1541197 RepID=UPI001269EAC5|nr:hypothetical protein [Planococcus sp. CAU13]